MVRNMMNKGNKEESKMKKINIMFFLVLVMTLVACDQEMQIVGRILPGTKPGQTGASEEVSDQEVSYEGMTDEERKVATERLRTETAKAFKALKKTRDDYSNKIDKAMKSYYAIIAETKHVIAYRVEIPAEVKGFTKEKDSAKFYASLGYDRELIEKLNDLIRGLTFNGHVSAEDIQIVTGILKMLVELDDANNKILDEHLNDENLAKIEKNKTKIDTATKELNAFIASRDAFIAGIKNSIEVVHACVSNAEAMVELNKLIATTSTTIAEEAGYCHSRVEAVKKNEKTLAGLFS
ncbi:hypothetical protein [Borrelia sp. P9F1]|uniref:hypothetical protein n=1 Tax=Borrelia sp. P9F1 TaxID=3058374 RepID=UPI0026470CC0|nr:hypothetical protein [Borrelia sp. P9F1]WKC58682.1 hypothetical protein QYZ68_05620 [Borrelia sp. P9F1]